MQISRVLWTFDWSTIWMLNGQRTVGGSNDRSDTHTILGRPLKVNLYSGVFDVVELQRCILSISMDVAGVCISTRLPVNIVIENCCALCAFSNATYDPYSDQ
jgi:hypothetical protein